MQYLSGKVNVIEGNNSDQMLIDNTVTVPFIKICVLKNLDDNNITHGIILMCIIFFLFKSKPYVRSNFEEIHR